MKNYKDSFLYLTWGLLVRLSVLRALLHRIQLYLHPELYVRKLVIEQLQTVNYSVADRVASWD